MISRRDFLKLAGTTGAALYLTTTLDGVRRVFAVPIDGGTLDPLSVSKYAAALVKPPAMPGVTKGKFDKYKIAVRQFQQQILPAGLPQTTVWSYGSKDQPGTVFEGGTFFYPAFTLEAVWNRRLQVDWINDLVDPVTGNYLPHILPVDQTLHWANPPGGKKDRDRRGSDPTPYTGPVPIVTHVHGAHTTEESDGYPEAWYLPAATNIPKGYAETGTYFDNYNKKYKLGWNTGTATFSYPNDMRDTTLWYHDHTLGMTRVNVYAGPAGFYLIRGNPDDVVAGLPGPAPSVGDSAFGTYYEIPIVIQDRSFNADGSLFYPDNRAFFEGMEQANLQIPFTPDVAIDGGISDVAPIWNPEFFGNMMVVNGQSWPYLDVEKRRYRFRLLNGCNSRFLILDFNAIPGVEVWQIGADGGFLPAAVNITAAGNRILMAPAERADVIIDFAGVPDGNYVLNNLGPDEPFGGGDPDDADFPLPDPDSTGQVMQFRVGGGAVEDPSTPPDQLLLPMPPPLNLTASTRPVTLNEEESLTVFVPFDADADEFVLTTDGRLVAVPEGTEYPGYVSPVPTVVWEQPWEAAAFAPTAALLGAGDQPHTGLLWNAPVTESPALGSTETWEIYNHTVDAHPIHIHLVQFQVVDRQSIEGGPARPPESGETGLKDTVIAYPGEITRVQATFTIAGRYVWHCHIVEHEDNEMMRPYDVV